MEALHTKKIKGWNVKFYVGGPRYAHNRRNKFVCGRIAIVSGLVAIESGLVDLANTNQYNICYLYHGKAYSLFGYS